MCSPGVYDRMQNAGLNSNIFSRSPTSPTDATSSAVNSLMGSINSAAATQGGGSPRKPLSSQLY
jgi:hypothetical protein